MIDLELTQPRDRGVIFDQICASSRDDQMGILVAPESIGMTLPHPELSGMLILFLNPPQSSADAYLGPSRLTVLLIPKLP